MKTRLFSALILLFVLPHLYGAVVTVNIANNSYTPSTVNINEGDQVHFHWVEGTHPTISTSGAWPAFTLSASQTDTTITFSQAGPYSYYCLYHQSLGMKGVINVATVTGIVPLTAGNIKVYPNPASVEVNIDLGNEQADQLSIMTVCGHEYLSEALTGNQTTFPLNLPEGEYILILKNQDKMISRRKLVVKK